jgi:hypothetical protein
MKKDSYILTSEILHTIRNEYFFKFLNFKLFNHFNNIIINLKFEIAEFSEETILDYEEQY